MSTNGQISLWDGVIILVVRQIRNLCRISSHSSSLIASVSCLRLETRDRGQHVLDDIRGVAGFMASGSRHLLHAWRLCTHFVDFGCDCGSGEDYSGSKDSLLSAVQKR